MAEESSKPTVLAWVQAECGVLHCGSILADVPDVKVDKDRDRSECCHSKPSQHEDVRQHDELKIEIIEKL